ncbi:MAG: 3-deoxy-manno-octulosonate cytidylyltransferase [Gammaproteobacteria bacterium RIFCSPHIGHO2_12_FULL_45_9]|nr:MAG: 3-deoxy-manno-octulosonate cytidylyltransferase [Gammaproteobacteria bacterium RIFCSPHIGHO2_12_FULL_45_9]
MDFTVIIPARLNSTRLPRKVLSDIHGKPMIQHVYERAVESGASRVIIAADNEEIISACEKFHANACLTSIEHQSGTERIAEVVANEGYDTDEIIIGLQADEPLMPPQLIRQLAENLAADEHVKVGTFSEKITNSADLFNPNIVKVVFNYRQYAMYFSRAPIPWDREWNKLSGIRDQGSGIDMDSHSHYRHIGIYGYRAGFLETYVNWPPCQSELLESLEQLRILWNGFKIHVGVTDLHVPAGIDTAEGLEVVRKFLKKH